MPLDLTSCGLISACNIFLNAGSSTDENIGAVYVQNNFSGANGFGVIVSRNGSSTTAAISIGSDSSNNGLISTNNTDLRLGKNQSGTFNEYMRINTSGNVGIGTTSPTPHNGNNALIIKGNGGRGIMELHDGSAVAGKSVFQQVEGDTYIGQLDRGTGSGRLYFLTGGSGTSATISMTILCAGNVGINVTTPSTKLHICNPVNQAYNPLAFNSDLHALHIQFCNQNQRAGLIRFTSHGNLENTFGVVQMGCSDGGTGCGQGDFVFQAYRTEPSPAYSELMRLTRLGNVGIGTTSPRYSLDVAGGAMSTFYMSCCSSTIDGIGPYDYGIIGSGNGAGALLINDIVGARYSVAAGSYNLTFRKSVRNTTGACVYCTVMTFVGTTDTNCVPNVNIENSLGVGVASPSYRLHVNGTFYAAGSSQDYKEGICQYDTDSCLFMCLKPKTYQYKDEWKHLGKDLKSETQIGLIAEEVAESHPELAILVNEEDNKVVRNVDYEKLSIVLLAEVQKLRQEVDQLKQN
jgi:hypothetical protein